MVAQQLPAPSVLAKIPVTNPPPGYTALTIEPDFYPREDGFMAVGIILPTISFLFVAGRVLINYTEKRRKLGWDDLFAALGWVSVVSFCIFAILVRKIYCENNWDLSLNDLNTTELIELFCQGITLDVGNFFARGAILLLYLRIFSPHRNFRWMVYLALILLFLSLVATITAAVVFCTPPPGKDFSIFTVQSCPRSDQTSYYQGPFYFLMDVFIFVAPIREVLKLNLPKKRLMLVVIIFATGFFAVCCSLISFIYRYIIILGPDSRNGYRSYPVLVAIMFELNTCLVVSSIPAFASLIFQRARGKKILAKFRARYLSALKATKHSTTVNAEAPKRAKVVDPSDTLLRVTEPGKTESSPRGDSTPDYDIEKGEDGVHDAVVERTDSET